jgi:rubrerythrin
MSKFREFRATGRTAGGAILAALIAAVAFAAGTDPAGPPVAATNAGAAPAALPVVEDTPKNLQVAFTGEMNAKARYESAARKAQLEGYPYVAELMRACAAAEQVHGDQHVHAIAWSGGEAKAMLDRLSLGKTEENLRAFVELETYEATQLYPAMLAQARHDGKPEAVRSMNYALAAEREHAALFQAALETLDRRLPEHPIYVCPTCGNTTEALKFDHCPNCFTPAKKFMKFGTSPA